MQQYQARLRKSRAKAWQSSAQGNKDQAMNNRIVYLLVIITLMASPVNILAQQKGDGASGEVLTLDEAISIALRDSRQVKNTQLAFGNAGDALAATRPLRLPSMHLYTLASQQLVKQDSTLDNSSSNLIPGVAPFFSLSLPTRPTAIFGGQILQPLSQQYRIGLN